VGGVWQCKKKENQDSECKGMTTDQVKKVVKEECVKCSKKMYVSKKKSVSNGSSQFM
jgi:uncharacterized paraquat-inducible protein A